MMRAIFLIALATPAGCRQATPAEVGAQSIRDAQPDAIVQATERAGRGSSRTVVPEAAKGGAFVQKPPQAF